MNIALQIFEFSPKRIHPSNNALTLLQWSGTFADFITKRSQKNPGIMLV